MTKTIYQISSHRRKWCVKLNNQVIADEFNNKAEAIKLAYNAMKKNIESGRNAQISIRDRDGEWKIKCNSSIHDIFPFNRLYAV